MENKTLAFLINCPEPGKVMLFPGFYEDIKEEVDQHYDENFQVELSKYKWVAKLKGQKYKIFEKKTEIKNESN